MNVFYFTFGCKVNQYETENIRELLVQRGYTTVPNHLYADICVINTCTVTAQSDSKCRQLIHKIKTENPNCILICAGCMTQAHKNLSESLTECDIIVGSHNKTSIPDMLEKYLSNHKRIVCITENFIGDTIETMSNKFVESKTRAYIKIQDGCDMNCTYCIIPKARGHIRSKSIDNIVSEAMTLISSGHKELILTGINLCCYGRETNAGLRLIDAIEAVCNLEGNFRVRLGSVEPEMILDEDIKRLSDLKKFCPQFHLSLQSGCDKTLSDMKRHYNTSEYRQLCDKLRSSFEICAITTDIMVGFPQETDDDFNASCQFVKEISFSDAHIFPYSRRPDTPADKMSGQIDGKTKKERAKIMADICNISKKNYLSSLIGQKREVLFEQETSSDFHQGHTIDYVLVKVPYEPNDNSFKQQIHTVKIISSNSTCCFGIIDNQ